MLQSINFSIKITMFINHKHIKHLILFLSHLQNDTVSMLHVWGECPLFLSMMKSNTFVLSTALCTGSRSHLREVHRCPRTGRGWRHRGLYQSHSGCPWKRQDTYRSSLWNSEKRHMKTAYERVVLSELQTTEEKLITSNFTLMVHLLNVGKQQLLYSQNTVT